MTVTHAAATRNALAEKVRDLIDGGVAAGTIEFQTSAGVEVATLTFSDPSFGSAASGVITAASITDDTDATGGTIAKAVFKDSAGTAVLTCSVTATDGGGDIELSAIIITAGQTVGLTSLTYTAPT